MQRHTLLAVFCTLFTSSQLVHAGDLYRCGNTFQDTPCQHANSGQAIKKISGLSNDNSSATSNTKIDFDCKQRGEKAKKIMWMREIGKTADDQIAAPPDGASPSLIKEVYTHRGSSIEVRNAIEQACIEQKERDKLAALMMAGAQKLRAGDANPTAIANNQPVNNATIIKNELPKQVAASTDNKLEKCHAIKTNLTQIADKKRTGGSAQSMENLRREQNDLNAEFKFKGCS